MKKAIALCIILALVPLCACAQWFPVPSEPTVSVVVMLEEPAATPEPVPVASRDTLTVEEMRVDLAEGSLLYGDSPEQAVELLGTPRDEEEYEEGATGDNVIVYRYGSEDQEDSLTLEFHNRSLIRVQVSTEAVSAAESIRCGMSFMEVCQRLRLPDAPLSEEGETIFFARMIGGDEGLKHIPPEACAEREAGGGLSLWIAAPRTPYPADMDPWDHVFESHCSLHFVFSPDMTLREWGWYVGAFAE